MFMLCWYIKSKSKQLAKQSYDQKNNIHLWETIVTLIHNKIQAISCNILIMQLLTVSRLRRELIPPSLHLGAHDAA